MHSGEQATLDNRVQSEWFAARLSDRARLRPALRSITYHIGWDWIPEGFSNTSFFGPPDFEPDDHALFTSALTVDLFVFVDALARRR